MKFLSLIIIIVIFSGAVYADGFRLELGEVLPSSVLSKQVSPPQKVQSFTKTFDPFVLLEVHDIQYTIAYDAANRVITYIYTSDLRFSTKQGLKVGDEISLSRDQISFYTDWQVYAPTTCDGWKPVIGYDREPKTFFFEANVPPYTEPENPRTLFKGAETVKFTILGFAKSRPR